jgi:hypothetical protein
MDGHRRIAAVLRACGAMALAAALIAVSAMPAPASTNYLPRKLAELTNERYGHDCFWAPPKGMDYAFLPGAKPIQKPNLYPDVGSTYFVAQYILPAGASLTLKGTFPRERYMSFTMFRPLTAGQIGSGDNIRDHEINPDPGYVNPFRTRNRRNLRGQEYTVHIKRGPVPARPEPNTIYTGQTDPTQRLGMSQRNYLPDKGLDGTGGVGLPKVILNMPDGRKLTGEAACRVLQPTEDRSTSTFPQDWWEQLVANSKDPENFPAVNPPRWDRFWNALYSVAGLFVDDEAQRRAQYPPRDQGGFQSNPDTRYMITSVSLRYGDVVTVSGKLPTFPRTLPRAVRWNPRSWQVRFWSLCTGSSPVTGLGYDCVYDQQVPLRGDRRYTLVISRRGDRPKNARPECGYRWLWFGKGENYPEDNPAPSSRNYVGTLYMRFMAPNPNWANAPHKVTEPGTEQRVMGPYFPRSRYYSKSEFEKLGCRGA